MRHRCLEEQFLAGRISAGQMARLTCRLEEQQTKLRAMPSRPERIDWQPTGETFAGHWAGLTEPQRHAFLLASGIRADVHHIDAKTLANVPEEALLSPSDFDPDGRTRVVFGRGLKVTVRLGTLADLREMASQRG